MRPDEQKQYFKDIYESRSDRILRFVVLRIASREEAVDITEEVFYQFWRVLCDGKSVANFEALLFTIARNKVIDWYRKRRADSLDALVERAEDNESTLFEVADEAAHHTLLLSSEAKWVLEVLRKLPPQYQEVVSMRFVDGLEPAQIAAILRITPNAVSLRLNHALEKLRQELGIN